MNSPAELVVGGPDIASDYEITIVRLTFSRRVGKVTELDMHHLVRTESGIEHFVETRHLALTSTEDYVSAVENGSAIKVGRFVKLDLSCSWNPYGFIAWARDRAKVLQVRSQDRSLRSVALFYLLAFAVSWSIVIPQAAASRGLIDVQLPGAVGFLSPLAPMLAAMLMSWRAGGTAELKRLLRSLLAWRVAPRWYAVVLLGFPLLALVAVVLSFVMTGHRPDLSANYIHNVFPQFPRNLSPWLLFLPFLVFSIVTTIPEETGWRGFALPRLQLRWGPLLASLVVGSLWGLWHLPDFFYLQSVQSGISFPLFLAGTVSTSILFTWIFNGTGGSLLMVSILHSSFNAGDAFLPLLPQVTGTKLQLALYLALITAVAVILIVCGRLHFEQRSARDPSA